MLSVTLLVLFSVQCSFLLSELLFVRVLYVGYDSDEGGKGGRGVSGGAKKALSVQDQMVYLIFFFSTYCGYCVKFTWVVSACDVWLRIALFHIPSAFFMFFFLLRPFNSLILSTLTMSMYIYEQKADLAALMLHDDSPLASVEDYWTIQPRRTEMIMKWLHEPFLKNALEGFYVRFAIGKQAFVLTVGLFVVIFYFI